MGRWAAVAASKATVQSSYITAGRYVGRVNNWRGTKNRKGEEIVFLEMTVLASDNHITHPVGSDFSWGVSMRLDMAGPNLKAALMAMLDIPEDQVTEDMFDKAIAVDGDPAWAGRMSPFQGMVLDLVATNIKTRAGKDFTRVQIKVRNPGEEIPTYEHFDRPAVASVEPPDGVESAV